MGGKGLCSTEIASIYPKGSSLRDGLASDERRISSPFWP